MGLCLFTVWVKGVWSLAFVLGFVFRFVYCRYSLCEGCLLHHMFGKVNHSFSQECLQSLEKFREFFKFIIMYVVWLEMNVFVVFGG